MSTDILSPAVRQSGFFSQSLADADPEIFGAIGKELKRQQDKIELIASENIVSKAVLEATGSIFTNKYAEGYPGKRYYGGCEYADIVETLAIERAKQLFGAAFANVQPNSGSQMNQAVFLALLQPGDTFMGLDLSSGGHLTHGSPVNMSGKWFKPVPYGVRPDDHQIDMDEVARIARECKPKLIICGGTAYSRVWDFPRFREIADEVGAILMVDAAHFIGLVAGKAIPSPVPYADVVTFTTHKVLRGPRGGMILTTEEHAAAIDKAVFPMMQGGPLMHAVAAKAVALKEAMTPEYQQYAAQVVRNAQALSASLAAEGMRPVSGGTDTHLALIDLRGVDVTGAEAEVRCDAARITMNKNAIPYDPQPPAIASGIRVGTPSVTTQGMGEPEMIEIGRLIARAVVDPASSAAVASDVSDLVDRFPAYPESPVGV